MRKRMVIGLLTAFAALLLAAAANATLPRYYTSVRQMQNTIAMRGVDFTGFKFLRGYRVKVDIARCIGLPRYGMRGRLYHGFKCRITTPDESKFNIWVLATGARRFWVDSANLIYSASAKAENCIQYGGDWAYCLSKYARHH
jgi:hypothetical protein